MTIPVAKYRMEWISHRPDGNDPASLEFGAHPTEFDMTLRAWRKAAVLWIKMADFPLALASHHRN